MRKVGAFLLETSEDTKVGVTTRVRHACREWLRSKGMPEDLATGTGGEFELTRSKRDARIRWDFAEASIGRWEFFCLEEDADDGQTFRTTASITTTEHTITVFVTLEVGFERPRLAQLRFDARPPCGWRIRNYATKCRKLIELHCPVVSLIWDAMRDVVVLLVHLIASLAKLLGRPHTSLDGKTPSEITGNQRPEPIALADYRWKRHCRGLFQLPVAA